MILQQNGQPPQALHYAWEQNPGKAADDLEDTRRETFRRDVGMLLHRTQTSLAVNRRDKGLVRQVRVVNRVIGALNEGTRTAAAIHSLVEGPVVERELVPFGSHNKILGVEYARHLAEAGREVMHLARMGVVLEAQRNTVLETQGTTPAYHAIGSDLAACDAQAQQARARMGEITFTASHRMGYSV